MRHRSRRLFLAIIAAGLAALAGSLYSARAGLRESWWIHKLETADAQGVGRAAWELGEIGSPRAIAALARRLEREEPPPAQDELTRAISKLSEREWIAWSFKVVWVPPRIPGECGSNYRPSTAYWPEHPCARAISRAGPAAVPTLVRLLDHRERHVRVQAAHALGRIGPGAAAAIPALEEMGRRDPDLRIFASRTLQAIRGEFPSPGSSPGNLERQVIIAPRGQA